MAMIFIHNRQPIKVTVKKQEYLTFVCKSKHALVNFSSFFKELSICLNNPEVKLQVKSQENYTRLKSFRLQAVVGAEAVKMMK